MEPQLLVLRDTSRAHSPDGQVVHLGEQSIVASEPDRDGGLIGTMDMIKEII